MFSDNVRCTARLNIVQNERLGYKGAEKDFFQFKEKQKVTDQHVLSSWIAAFFDDQYLQTKNDQSPLFFTYK